MIYLDSSALVKLIKREQESGALATWLNARGDEEMVASVLVEVEVPRALRGSDPAVLASMAGPMSRLNRVEMDRAVRATAGAYVSPHLRSLDAVHLATAETLVASGHSLRAFVTYDKRLADAAAVAGLPVANPGQ